MKLLAVDTQTLPGLQFALSDRTRNAVGALGERWAALTLQASGYVVRSLPHRSKRGDLEAISRATGEIIRIEIKTARKCKDGKWRFLLRKQSKQDHRHADVVILLAVTLSGDVVPFVLPVRIVADQRQAVITSHPARYAGKLAPFRQSARHIVLPN